jgi:ergothioneine biosynthesis protein EgtB
MTSLVTEKQNLATPGARYLAVRATTEDLAAPLSPEDQTVQSMPDVSPTKWHRAHTTWFFETFLLEPWLPGYTLFEPTYAYLFNSYYETLGARHPRPARGLLSRPGIAQVASYRRHVDEAMQRLVDTDDGRPLLDLFELGLNHEQQHQELLLMDIKHVLSQNLPEAEYTTVPASGAATCASPAGRLSVAAALLEHDGGLCEIGYKGSGFSFDNELPAHVVYLQPFALDARPVTCAEWTEFIEDGGYNRPELWLSDGWAACTAERWEAPLYWTKTDGAWTCYTLRGSQGVVPSEPVCHVSYYEADAFARWAGARLPTEAEWEVVASSSATSAGSFLDSRVLHPRQVSDASSIYVDVWQWTSSPYGPYPGFKPASGAVGEYNGKFMVNQYVLRGGCCVTPAGHVRATYRNFFPPSARWAFSGLRLAHDG